MSKFDSGDFEGYFAVNAEKYTKEEAIEIFEAETDGKIGDSKGYFAIENAYARHRAGVTEDNEPRVCWWLEYQKHKRSCPVWEFRRITE